MSQAKTTGAMRRVPSERDMLLRDLNFLKNNLIASKYIKCRKKETGLKVCIENGNKLGYGLSGVISILGRTFSLSKRN